MSTRRGAAGVAALWLALGACGDDSTAPPPEPPAGTTFVFDLSADLGVPETFYEVPYPSDLRLTADGRPDLRGFPNPAGVGLIAGLLQNASEARGFPVLPVAYLRFSGPLAPRDVAEIVPASPTAPLLLLDVDPASAERGKLYPVVARTLEPDPFTPENVLAVAPLPGFVLRPGVKHAVVVAKSALDAAGAPLGENAALGRVLARAPATPAEQTAADVYADLPDALALAGVPLESVAAATVFTTGRVAAEMASLGEATLAAHDVSITDLAVDSTELYPELCVVRGTVVLPQFQGGTPPFDTDGRLVLDAAGAPVVQRTETAPVVLTIPRGPMPAAGYPALLNVHGSGGYSIAMVRPVGDDGMPGDPIGPAFPNATKGIAMAGFAMPLNPERFPGAEETEYLNVENLAAMRDTFRQGALEARLFVEALGSVQIPAATLATCTGATLPPGVPSFRLDVSKLGITGQSMGGMYTNIIGATDPMLKAAVPTGAGGHWTHFILRTQIRDGQIPGFLVLVLGTTSTLTFLHPVLSIGAAGLEPADPIVYMPHVARRPLPGHPVRPIYEPVGKDDSYFPTTTYDAVALAYGHRQAGEETWPEMQATLAYAGLDGLIPYPVSDDVVSETGEAYTGVVVQYVADGPYDSHAIYSHRDDVKRQYACFWDSFMKTGKPVVVAPTTDWAAPCP